MRNSKLVDDLRSDSWLFLALQDRVWGEVSAEICSCYRCYVTSTEADNLMNVQNVYCPYPTPSGRAVTRPAHLPWSSGHDFRLSLTLRSAGDRGSIPRGRVFFGLFYYFPQL